MPLKPGLSPKSFDYIFKTIVGISKDAYSPDAIVVQCGADGLAFDRLGKWNLNVESISEAVRFVLDFKKPTLLLGGGGYNSFNAARLWAKCTSIAVGCEIPDEIPEHPLWKMYGPGNYFF